MGICYYANGRLALTKNFNFAEFEQIFGVDSLFGVMCMKCTFNFREIHDVNLTKARSNGAEAKSVGKNTSWNINQANAPNTASNATEGSSNSSAPSNTLPTVSSSSSHISTPKTDKTFSIHLSKFDVDKKWTDIAEYITAMTKLELKTHFTVLKLLPRRKEYRRSLSFVSFRINAVNKDVFDKIMTPGLWTDPDPSCPGVVASKFDSSISRLKRSQRESEGNNNNNRKSINNKTQIPKKAPNQRKVKSFEHQPQLGVQHNHGPFNYPRGSLGNFDCHQCNWGRNHAPLIDVLFQQMNVLLQSMTQHSHH